MPVTFFVIQTHREVLCRVRQYWLTYEVFCIKLRRNIRQCWLIAHSSEKFLSENILLVYARLGIFSKLLLSKVDSRLDELDECWQRRRLVRKWTYWGAHCLQILLSKTHCDRGRIRERLWVVTVVTESKVAIYLWPC